MILVDSSVWVDHLRKGDVELIHRLQENQILIHPFVIGELACGSLEAMAFIEAHALMARGMGYIDAHLGASAQLSNAKLGTRDKRLRAMATEMGWSYQEAAH